MCPFYRFLFFTGKEKCTQCTQQSKKPEISAFFGVYIEKNGCTHMYTPAPKCTHLPLLRIKYRACERSLFEMQMAKNSVFSAFFACLMCGTCCWSVCVHRTMYTAPQNVHSNRFFFSGVYIGVYTVYMCVHAEKIMYTAKKPEISAFFGWCVHCVHGLGGVYIFIRVCSHRG